MTVRRGLRTLAWRAVPGVMAERARDYERHLRARNGLTTLAESFAALQGGRVLRGPLRGLRLALHRLDEIDFAIPKLLGAYEQEIHPALQRAIDAGPSRFIDLGSADGYYAVGVALAAAVPVDAFELSRSARSLTKETARLNGVQRLVAVHGQATTTNLERLPLARALVLCDIEGAERKLFTPRLIRRLRTGRVIVEMHRTVHPDVESVLVDRFVATHDVSVVQAVRRNPSAYPELDTFEDAEDRDHAVQEMRYRLDGLRWLIAEPQCLDPASPPGPTKC